MQYITPLFFKNIEYQRITNSNQTENSTSNASNHQVIKDKIKAAGKALLTMGFVFTEAYFVKSLMHASDLTKSDLYMTISGVALLNLSGSLFCGFMCYYNSKFPHLQFRSSEAFDPHKIMNDKEKCLAIVRKGVDKIENEEFFKTWDNKGPSIDDTCELLRKKILEGVCWGHSLSLLLLMSRHSNAISEDLIAKVTVDNVIFWQMISWILLENPEANPFSILFEEEELDALCNIQSYYHNVDFHCFKSKKISLQENLQLLIENYHDTRQKIIPLDNFAIAGTVFLFPKKSSKEEDLILKDTSNHALFFQCSHGFFRFCDYSGAFPGFYDFPNEELFCENLLTHVKTTWSKKFADGEIQLVFHEIEKKLSGSDNNV